QTSKASNFKDSAASLNLDPQSLLQSSTNGAQDSTLSSFDFGGVSANGISFSFETPAKPWGDGFLISLSPSSAETKGVNSQQGSSSNSQLSSQVGGSNDSPGTCVFDCHLIRIVCCVQQALVSVLQPLRVHPPLCLLLARPWMRRSIGCFSKR